MSIKDFDDIKVPRDIDKAIEKGMKKFEEENELKSKKNKKRYIGMAAAIAGVITLGISNPAIASKIPFVGSTFEKLEDINNGKDYKKYATAINQKVESNGIGVTISEAVSDGIYVYLTYVIENNEGFSDKILEEAKEWEEGKQIMAGWNANVDFSDKELTSSTSLNGKFIDKNTYIGMEKYLLSDANAEIPNEFKLTKNIRSLTIEGQMDFDRTRMKGKWNFEIPVTVNKDLTKTIEVNKESNGYKVDKIHISPFEMVIEKSYLGMIDKMLPEHEKEIVTVFDDKGNELYYHSGSATKLYVESPNEECKSIRILVQKQKLAKAIDGEKDSEGNIVKPTAWETQGYEEDPIMDIVIPIK